MDRRSFRLLALLGLLLASTFAVLHADLGWSPSSYQPVSQAILERLPATIELAFFALVATVVLGAIAGFARARTRPPALRGGLALLQLAVRAIPIFVLATLLQMLAMFRTSLPIAGMTSGAAFGLRDHLTHLILPVLILAVPFGAWSSLIFHDFFRARGNASRTELRSLVEPVATTVAFVGPALLTATLLIEPRFAWPGVARLFFNGLSQLDLALAAGCLLTYSAGVVLLKLCAAFSPSSSPRNLASRPPGISVVTIVALVVLLGAALAAAGANVIAPFDPNFID
ncbi:MAG TPA: ABC transporter permease [Candidatus Elarobacter sp.]|nr:ABC transporter permease [Candidatus Elarobacter sp.]